MKKKNRKMIAICRFPKCKLEVHEQGEKFCGIHQRKIESSKKNALSVGGSIGVLFIGVALKGIKDKYS